MNNFGMRLAMAIVAMGMLAVSIRSSEAPGAREEASFAISFPAARSDKPLDGRVILLVSRDLTREPRSHVEPDEPLASPYIFGVDVSQLSPGRTVILDDNAFGWPAAQLSKLPSGDYLVQAVLNRYEAFHLHDGRNLMLPPDKGEGQHWGEQTRQSLFEAHALAHRCGESAENCIGS